MMRKATLIACISFFFIGGTAPSREVTLKPKIVDELDYYRMQFNRNKIELTKKKVEIIETQYQIIQLME